MIVALGGWDTIRAGAGNDVVCGGVGAYRLLGAGGNDRLHGGRDGITAAREETFGDAVAGGAGNDLLDGGPGWQMSSGGQDEVVYARASGPIAADLVTGVATGQGADRLVSIQGVSGDPFDDELRGTGWLRGRGGNDALLGGVTLIGDDGDDVLRASASATYTQLAAGPGDDRLHGSEGYDLLDGDTGDDVIRGYGGHDVIRGESGDDVIYGGPVRDYVQAGSGADEVAGGPGDDWIGGGLGYDRANGGPHTRDDRCGGVEVPVDCERGPSS